MQLKDKRLDENFNENLDEGFSQEYQKNLNKLKGGMNFIKRQPMKP